MDALELAKSVKVIPHKENLAKWNEGNALVDEHGQPLRLYRGAVGHKELPEDFLNGKTRGTYATFTSTSPYVAATYAHPTHEFDPHQVGGVMAIHAHAHKLHEFPSKDGRFDMFAFDDFARRLPKGHAVVVRNVVDIGPRGSLETDPEKKFSYPSDIYAWHEANSVKSATGNNGQFDPSNPDITKKRGGSIDQWHHQHLSEAQHFEKGGEVDPPMNTVKAYKLFRTKPSAPDQLFPLFVNANKPVPMGQWVSAEVGPAGKNPKKVKSSLGDLAYRPGWHSGDLPVATHIGGKSSKDLKAPDYRPDNHVWAEVEHPADVDWQTEANSRMQYTKDGKPILSTAHITDQVPNGGFYRYKTNPNMTGNWLISGGMKVNRVLGDDEVKAINDAHGVADLPRLRKP